MLYFAFRIFGYNSFAVGGGRFSTRVGSLEGAISLGRNTPLFPRTSHEGPAPERLSQGQSLQIFPHRTPSPRADRIPTSPGSSPQRKRATHCAPKIPLSSCPPSPRITGISSIDTEPITRVASQHRRRHDVDPRTEGSSTRYLLP